MKLLVAYILLQHLFGLFVVDVVHNLNNSDIVHPVKWFSLVLRYNFKVK